jgi:hypothetical protein
MKKNRLSRKLLLLVINFLALSYSFVASIETCAARADKLTGQLGKHTCVIQADNTVVCWGIHGNDQAMPPSGIFLQISPGGEHTCGIRADKTVTCWGLNDEGQATPPTDTFLQVDAGLWHTCGIRTDNTVACWGSNNPYWAKEDPYLTQWKNVKTLGQAEPPKGTFLQISAGGRHTCGLRTDHTVACWGSHLSDPIILAGVLGNSQSTPLSGEFTQVTAGFEHSCGLRPDQTMECWGGFGQLQSPEKTSYLQIYEMGYSNCGIKPDHTASCFGGQDLTGSETLRIPNSTCSCSYINSKGKPQSGNCACTTSSNYTFSRLLPRSGSACGIRSDNTIACWGFADRGQTFPPEGLIAKSADKSTCLVYGVHNDTDKTQLFIVNVNAGPIEVYPRSNLDENYHIEALAIAPASNRIYAASAAGNLYEVRNGAQTLFDIGTSGFENIKALAFHPDGSLWGWAQNVGLFRITLAEKGELNLPGTVIIPYDKEIKIEDITWNTADNLLYGIENLEQGNKLWVYNQDNHEASWVCGELMDSLKNPVNALEMISNEALIFTYEKNEKLAFGIIDLPTCQITTEGEINTPYYQVKGVAWPNCSYPDVVE